MNITNAQKKYIKKNVKRIPLKEIATNLQIPKAEIENYLKNRWGEEKYLHYVSHYEQIRNDREDNIESKLHFLEFVKKYWTVFFFFFILIFAVYFNSLHNEFVSDDIDGILKNPNIGKFQISFPFIGLRPILLFIVYKIGGLDPMYFRLLNILIHIGTVWTVFILIYYMETLVTAFFAATIVAVHPILIESVAWISGGHYSQYALFSLCSLLAYIFSQKNKKWLIVSFLFFLASLFSNEKAVIFPLILFVYELSKSTLKKNWKKLTPFFIVLLIGGIYYGSQIGTRLANLRAANYQEVGMDKPWVQMPIAIVSYLRLMFWPDQLTLYHSELNFSVEQYLLYVFLFVSFIGLIIFTYFKDKKLFFWLIFFPITLLPVLTPLRISWVVAERYVYLGAIAIFIVFSILLEKLTQKKEIRLLVYLLFSVIIIALMVRTIYRNIDWKNQDNLWLATGKTSPSDPKTHNNLGDVYGRHNQLEKSAEEFSMAIKLNPRYAEAYHNLANVYYRMENINKAIETYNQALYFNPRLWQSYQTLGVVYYNIADYSKSEENFKKAIAIIPENSDLYMQLGIVYLRTKDKQKAKIVLQQALSLNPNSETAKKALSEALK